MGLVPAAHKALGRQSGFVYLFEFDLPDPDLPDGTFRCALTGSYNSESEGAYPGIVTNCDPIVRDASDPSGHLTAVQFNVTIADQDRRADGTIMGGYLTRLKEGPYGDRIRGSAARVYRAHPELTRADWLPVFTGIVAGMGPLQGYSWSLTLRVDDRPLQEDIPAGWSLTRADWPTAAPDVFGTIAPWIYGKHSSLGLGDTGMVPAYQVDTVNQIWVLSAGYLKAVDNVYADDVLLVPTTEYTVGHPVKNGRQFTTVTLIGKTPTTVAADVQGVELVGDGTGALLENRGKQLAHILCNLTWGSYTSGAYQYTAAPLHISGGIPFEYAQLWFDAFGITGSRWLFGSDGLANGQSLLDEWCEDADMRAFWTTSGTLDAKPIDHRLTDIYLDTAWIREDEGDELGDSFSLDYDETRIVDNVVIQYLLSAAAGNSPLYTLEVTDTSSDEGVTEELTDHWAVAIA